MLSLTGTTAIQGHRFSWELHYGPIPEGMQVGHRCHDEDQSCVGLGSACPRRLATHCQRGHEFTAENIKWDAKRGTRACRICVNENQLRRYHERMGH